MVDTLHIRLHDPNLSDLLFTDQFKNRKNNTTSHIDDGIVYSGTTANYLNLGIYFTATYLRIEGSVCKYFKGKNIESLTYTELMIRQSLLLSEIVI
jgi:hypothetical protein